MSTAKPSTSLRVTIDPSRCVGYGRCAAIAPGVFMIDEDTGKAFFEEEDIAAVPPRDLFAAARACPTQAIAVHQFGRRVYPQIMTPMPAEISRRLADVVDESES